jgi:hypothetical protein
MKRRRRQDVSLGAALLLVIAGVSAAGLGVALTAKAAAHRQGGHTLRTLPMQQRQPQQQQPLAEAVVAQAQPSTSPFNSSSWRTTGRASVQDTGQLGGLQHFSLPVSQGSCPPAALYGFAKCLRLAGGGQAWRVVAAYGRVGFTRMESVAEDLSVLAGPYKCDPPNFYLQPATDSGSAAARVPLRVHEHGGLAFYPLALKAVVPARTAAPGYALRVEGSEYFAVLDAAGGCVEPEDPRSVAGLVEDEADCGGEGKGGEEQQQVEGDDDQEEEDGTEVISPQNMRAVHSRDLPTAAAAPNGTGSPQPAPANATAPCAGCARANASRPPGSRRLEPSRLPAASWVLVSVPPTWNDDLAAHVVRLREHLAWYQSIGFDGHLVYYDPAQISRLLADPDYRTLLKTYRVVLVRWAHFPRVTWLPWDAQGFRLSHAYLALWGTDAGLLPIDLDEFLILQDTPHHPAAAVPRRAALSQLVRHCGAGAGFVTFERYAVYCDATACPDGDESALWRPGPSDATAGGSSGGKAAGTAAGSSPLDAYTLIEAASHVGSKTWATASCAFPTSVHEHRLSGAPGCRHAAAAPGCGRLLHLINAFHKRGSGGAAGTDLKLLPFSHPWWPPGAAGGARRTAAVK